MAIYIEDVIKRIARGSMNESELKEWLSIPWNKDVACRYSPARGSSNEEKEAYYLVSGQIDWAEYHSANREAGTPVQQVDEPNEDGISYI